MGFRLVPISMTLNIERKTDKTLTLNDCNATSYALCDCKCKCVQHVVMLTYVHARVSTRVDVYHVITN